MAAFGISSILSLVGGSPLQKSSKNVIIENLKAVKSMDPGNISTLLSSVLSGGTGSIFQNPTAAVSSNLLSQITSSISAISGIDTGSVVTTALNSLTTQVNTNSSATNAMSGVSDPDGLQLGLMDVINHDTLTQTMFGSSIPSAVSMTTVTAPLNPTNISSIATSLATTISQYLAGTISQATAASQVSAYTVTLENLISASQAAFTALQAALQDLSNVMAAGAAIGSSSALLKGLLPTVVQSSVYDTLLAAIQEQIAP